MRDASEYCDQNVVTYIAGANRAGNKADELILLILIEKLRSTELLQ